MGVVCVVIYMLPCRLHGLNELLKHIVLTFFCSFFLAIGRRISTAFTVGICIPCEWTWEDLNQRNVSPPFTPMLVSPTHWGSFIGHNGRVKKESATLIIMHSIRLFHGRVTMNADVSADFNFLVGLASMILKASMLKVVTHILATVAHLLAHIIVTTVTKAFFFLLSVM